MLIWYRELWSFSIPKAQEVFSPYALLHPLEPKAACAKCPAEQGLAQSTTMEPDGSGIWECCWLPTWRPTQIMWASRDHLQLWAKVWCRAHCPQIIWGIGSRWWLPSRTSRHHSTLMAVLGLGSLNRCVPANHPRRADENLWEQSLGICIFKRIAGFSCMLKLRTSGIEKLICEHTEEEDFS